MNNKLRNIAVAALLSACTGIALIFTSTPDKTANIEFNNNIIQLNIPLSAPATCKEIIAELGIDDIPYKGKIYYPVCTTVEPDLIVVTYKEKIMI